ncbi:MAG: HIT domain-containing protein [Phycisphaeraceae bacterium]|nr:HIT domain-containing protein [Phycisphaeraceae bacterium]
MPADCPACARIDRLRRGLDPFFICHRRESVVLLHKHQRYPGWCSLFVTDHHEHLADLGRERQSRLWLDVMDVAEAIAAAFAPARLNYENLGNVVPHVHWHVIPRYAQPVDPEPAATVWVRPESERDCGVSDSQRDEFIARLRDAGLR